MCLSNWLPVKENAQIWPEKGRINVRTLLKKIKEYSWSFRSSNGHDSGVSCSPKQSPEFITEEMRLGAKVNTTEKGTMREFIESEISVIMKNLKVKKRVREIIWVQNGLDSNLRYKSLVVYFHEP